MSDEHLVIDRPKRTGRISVPTWLVYVLVFAAGLAISAFVGYAASSSSINARVSVLEAQRDEILRRLAHIETLLDDRLPKRPQ